MKPLLSILGPIVSFGLVIPAWIAICCGRVKVKGYGRAYRTLTRGRTLILSNHPSLVETVILPSLFWYWVWSRYRTLIPWSVADERLFGSRLWLLTSFRCIPTNRDMPGKYRTARVIYRHLRQGGNVLVYPEGGRTIKGEVFKTEGDRLLRFCDETSVRIGRSVGSKILPVWVSFPVANRPGTLFGDYLRLWRGKGMVINFGNPVSASEVADTGEVLLSCGQGE